MLKIDNVILVSVACFFINRHLHKLLSNSYPFRQLGHMMQDTSTTYSVMPQVHLGICTVDDHRMKHSSVQKNSKLESCQKQALGMTVGLRSIPNLSQGIPSIQWIKAPALTQPAVSCPSLCMTKQLWMCTDPWVPCYLRLHFSRCAKSCDFRGQCYYGTERANLTLP